MRESADVVSLLPPTIVCSSSSGMDRLSPYMECRKYTSEQRPSYTLRSFAYCRGYFEPGPSRDTYGCPTRN